MCKRWKLQLLLVAVVASACALPAFAAPPTPLPVAQRTFERYLAKRDLLTHQHATKFDRLATRLLADKPVAIKVATPADSRALFAAFRDARLGTRLLLDGCAPRADVAAQAILRAGFAAQKVNRFSLSGPLVVDEPGQTVKWAFHVAPAVMVRTPKGKESLRVLDPSLFDRPVAVRTWEKRMRAENGITLVTGPDQQSFDSPVLAGKDRVQQLGRNLQAAASLRSLEHELVTRRATKPKRN